jgi:hypothetical protein
MWQNLYWRYLSLSLSLSLSLLYTGLFVPRLICRLFNRDILSSIDLALYFQEIGFQTGSTIIRRRQIVVHVK